MKQVIRNITAVILAFAVLCSTVSFTVARHYCGNTVVDIAVFDDAEPCGMEARQLPDDSPCGIVKTHCCSDEKIVTKGQNELKTPLDDLTPAPIVFAASPYATCIDLYSVLEAHVVPYQGHSPPLLVRDIQLLNRTFLI